MISHNPLGNIKLNNYVVKYEKSYGGIDVQ